MKNLFNLTCAISLSALFYGDVSAIPDLSSLAGEIAVNADGSYTIDKNTIFTSTAELTLGSVSDPIPSNPKGTIISDVTLDNSGSITSLKNSLLAVQGNIVNQSTGTLNLQGRTLFGESAESGITEAMQNVLHNKGTCNISGETHLYDTRYIGNAGVINIEKGANFICAGNLTCDSDNPTNGIKFANNINLVEDSLLEIRSSSTITTKTETTLKGTVKIDGKLKSEDNLIAAGISNISGSGSVEVSKNLTLEKGAVVKISRLHLANTNSQIINHGGDLQILEGLDLPDDLTDENKFKMPLTFEEEALNMESNKTTADTTEKYVYDQIKVQFKNHFEGMLDIMGSNNDTNTEAGNAADEVLTGVTKLIQINKDSFISEKIISAHDMGHLEYTYPETEIAATTKSWKYLPQENGSEHHLVNLSSPYKGTSIEVNISDGDSTKSKVILGSLISLDKSKEGVQMYPINLKIKSTDDSILDFRGFNSLYKGDLTFDLSYESSPGQVASNQNISLIFNGKRAFPGGSITVAPSTNKVNVQIISSDAAYIKIDEGKTVDFSNANSLSIDEKVHFKIFGVLK